LNRLGEIIEDILQGIEDYWDVYLFCFAPLLISCYEILYFCWTWLKNGVGSVHTLCDMNGFGVFECSHKIIQSSDFVGLNQILIWLATHSIGFVGMVVMALFFILLLFGFIRG